MRMCLGDPRPVLTSEKKEMLMVAAFVRLPNTHKTQQFFMPVRRMPRPAEEDGGCYETEKTLSTVFLTL